MSRIIISGTHSGVGKTTVTGSIMKALSSSGEEVAPFKIGPDYIDPKFHKFITGNSSRNLDSWMLDEKTLKYLFLKSSNGGTISVIEGVMGLYDGFASGSIGSTAHIAKILRSPVILVADSRGISTSIAALISGYRDFDCDVEISGVILNRISGDKIYNHLSEIIEKNTGIECLGYLPDDPDFSLKSRHLGLVPVEEIDNLDDKINRLSAAALKHLNIKRIREIAAGAGEKPLKSDYKEELFEKKNMSKLRIGMAVDEAFSFYYQDNIDLMRESGIELTEFSPLKDSKLPDSIDGIYLGGGFPEEFASELSDNRSIMDDLKNKTLNGLPVFAECGGMMYLADNITTRDDSDHRMAGIFNCGIRMTEKLQRFGYVEVEYRGVITRGHEFHHSKIVDMNDLDASYEYTVKKPGRGIGWKCGLSKENVVAGYPHIHFYSNPEFFDRISELYRRQN